MQPVLVLHHIYGQSYMALFLEVSKSVTFVKFYFYMHFFLKIKTTLKCSIQIFILNKRSLDHLQ